MIKKTIFALAMGSCFAMMAQDAVSESNPATGGESVKTDVAFTENALTQMNAIVKKAKLKKAARKGKAAFSMQIAAIGYKPNHPDYSKGRQMAYERAFMMAKMDISRQLSAQISSSAAMSTASGFQKSDTATNDKLQQLVNAKLMESLKAQGVDVNDPAAVKAALPKVLNSTEFKKTTETAAAAYMIGVQAFRTVSDTQSVGVVAVYSEQTRLLATSMFGGQALPHRAPGADIEEAMEAMDPNVIASTFGIRPFVDEEGELGLIAFAQSALPSNSASSLNLAKSKARIEAEGMFREFAGQNATLSASLKKSQSITELEGDLGEMSVIDEKYSDKCALKGEKLNISGIQELETWTVKLPSGHQILCVAYYWNPSTAAAAVTALEKTQESAAMAKEASQKGRPVAPARKPAPQKKKAPKYKNVGTKGSGFESDFF